MEKFVPGFAMNRILRILGREIFFLLDNGYITPEQLDLAVKASIAPRMMVLGLVQRYDFTGLDLSARNLENPDFLEPPLDNRPKSLFDLVEEGNFGVKTGKGFFDYSGRKLEDVLRERDDKLLKVLKSLDFLIQ
jgi:3-hydroxybutyryl-CoA dehydrogenase